MEKSNLKWYLIIFALLVVIAALSLLLIFHRPAPLYRPIHGFLLHHSHRVLTVSDVGRIQNWMTFDYINKIFKLPSDYLKNTLNISDSRYPNLVLYQYASGQKIKGSDFIVQIQNAVRNYLTPAK